jgi:hypothetical protein
MASAGEILAEAWRRKRETRKEDETEDPTASEGAFPDIDQTLLRERVWDILEGVGLVAWTPEAMLWREVKDPPEPDWAVSTSKLLRALTTIEVILSEPSIASHIETRSRTRASSRESRQRAGVTERLDGRRFVRDWLADAKVIARAVEGIHAFHKSGPQKVIPPVDQALWLLADLWCDLLRFDCRPDDLPTGHESLFVQFATVVLGHIIVPREGTPNRPASEDQTPAGRNHAVGERWARARKLANKGLKARRKSLKSIRKHKI